jgi:hypothetical protein
VMGERAQERLADDSRRAGRDRAEQVALPGVRAGVGDGGFEKGGQGGRKGRKGAGSRDGSPVRTDLGYG